MDLPLGQPNRISLKSFEKEMDEQKRSPKHEDARQSLPEELRHVFDELVADYKFATIKQFGQGYVAYKVLADLVRVGWRHLGEPVEEEGQSQTGTS